MSRRSTKQRKSARVRTWIRKHLFREPYNGGRLFLGAISLLGGRPPFGPARLSGLGWRPAMNADGFIQEGK